ncbi:hypothetical protein BH09ACT7_BH09ACT7_36370 [soil metagenome]
MDGRMRHLTFLRRTLVLWALVMGMSLAASVSSAIALGNPSCTNVGSTTTLCQNPGNAQIVTSPGTVATPNFGWPYWGGGLVIAIGGGR